MCIFKTSISALPLPFVLLLLCSMLSSCQSSNQGPPVNVNHRDGGGNNR
jgi:hypothetical protein